MLVIGVLDFEKFRGYRETTDIVDDSAAGDRDPASLV